jgi:hypothetical protein
MKNQKENDTSENFTHNHHNVLRNSLNHNNTNNSVLSKIHKDNISKRENRSISLQKNVPTNFQKRPSKSMSLDQKSDEIFSKRKHKDYMSKSIIEKSKCSILKSKLDDIYQKQIKLNIYNNQTENYWKKMFRDLFEKEKIVDFSNENFIPKSLDKFGSYVMKLEKFWILWIEIAKRQLDLPSLVLLVNEALTYLTNATNIIKYFNTCVKELKISKKEISDYCQEHGIKLKDSNQLDSLLDSRCQVKIKTSEGKLQISQNNLAKNSSKEISKLDFNKKKQSEIQLENSESHFKYIPLQNIIPEKSEDSARENFQIDSHPYEASYLTIEETNNEVSLTTINLNKSNLVENRTELDSVNDVSSTEKKDDSNFIIATPDVRKHAFNFNTNDNFYDSSRLEEQLVTFAKQGHFIDTKSIVADIELITNTLKKEIEDMKSPQINFKNEIKHVCKESCCKIDKETKVESKEDKIEENLNDCCVVLEEDSYEKFLRDTAEKRGEYSNEYISYKNYTPKSPNKEDELNRGRTKTVSILDHLDNLKTEKKDKISKTGKKSKSKSKSKRKSKSKKKNRK